MSNVDPVLAAETPAFARAVTAIVTGDVPRLYVELAKTPALVWARSVAPHQATLLHYVAANGIAGALERPLPKADVLAKCLVGLGAKVDAPCNVYGGQWTTLELVVSSDHSYRARVIDSLVRVLCAHGAAIEGPLGDGSPLATALAVGILDGVQAVLGRGARTDNPIFAAAAGDSAWLSAWLDGTIETAARPLSAHLPLSTDRATAAEQALVFAAMCGQVDVIGLLLDRSVDVNACPAGSGWTATALHAAAIQGQREVVTLLLARGADPTITDRRFGLTPLEWTKSARLPRRPQARALAGILGG
jgi:hypothetical protein